MSLFDHPTISQRYFFPRRDRVREPLCVEAGGVTLECHHHICDPDALTVLHFHGNGEVVADYAGHLDRWFAALGVNSFFAEYRGYGGSTGAPALAGMLDDIPHLVAATGVPVSSLVFFGRSVGSIYAIDAAARFPNAAGLIIESGVAAPLERVMMRVAPAELGADIEALRREAARVFNHQRKLAAFLGPALFLHALHDDLVLVDNAERMRDWAGGEATLTVFPRGDHNAIFAANAADYHRAVGAFLAGLPRS